MSHRKPSWVLWTPDTFTFDALGYAFTVPRNDVSDTDSNSLNRVTGDIYWCRRSTISLLASSLWPPARRAKDGGAGGEAARNCAYFLVVAAKPPSRRVVSGEAADYVWLRGGGGYGNFFDYVIYGRSLSKFLTKRNKLKAKIRKSSLAKMFLWPNSTWNRAWNILERFIYKYLT